MSHDPNDGRGPRDPNDPLFAPALFPEDFGRIGAAVATTPELGIYEHNPTHDNPEMVGERRYLEQRARNEDLAREAQGGPLAEAYPWNRYDAPTTPGIANRLEERAEDLRALRGGLPDSPIETLPDR